MDIVEVKQVFFDGCFHVVGFGKFVITKGNDLVFCDVFFENVTVGVSDSIGYNVPTFYGLFQSK